MLFFGTAYGTTRDSLRTLFTSSDTFEPIKVTGAQDMPSPPMEYMYPQPKAPKDTMRTFTTAKCGGRRR